MGVNPHPNGDSHPQEMAQSGIYRTSLFSHYTRRHAPGGIISPVIANMTLDGLERLLSSHFSKTSRKGRKAKVNLIRYADDFIITGDTKELLEQEVKPLVEQFMRERGLELSPEKTVITHIEGFDF